MATKGTLMFGAGGTGEEVDDGVVGEVEEEASVDGEGDGVVDGHGLECTGGRPSRKVLSD